MSAADNNERASEPEDRPTPVLSIYDEDGVVLENFVAGIIDSIEAGDRKALHGRIIGLHSSELGDLIEALAPEYRQPVVAMMGADFDFTALTEIDEAIRLEIIADLPNEEIARSFEGLDSDDAVFILEDLDGAEQEDILSKLPFTERIRLRRSLDYPEESSGRRMQTEFVAVPPFWTVGQTIDYMREDKDLPDAFSQIFVIDATFHLIGAIDLDRILLTQRSARIEEIMHEARHAIPVEMDQEEEARIFERYDLLSIAVVDENQRLACLPSTMSSMSFSRKPKKTSCV